MQALMSVLGVRRAKAALSSGCKSHPATAPAGSNRSSHGGNEVAEAFDYPKRDAIQRTQGVVVAMNSFVISGLAKRRAELAGDIEKTHETSLDAVR
jgi:hypothetical protein